MKKRNKTENKKMIDGFVDKLKSSYKPDLVVLFGSRTRANFDKDSDIDLLIVKDTKKRPLWRRVEVRKVLSTEEPLDVIVYTPDEFSRLRESGSAFIEDILNQGEVVYEKKQ